MEFTVLLPVYHKDIAEHLKIAIESSLNQTLMPNEILILVDGEVGVEIKAILDLYEMEYFDIVNIVYFEKNRGLGKVLRDGVVLAKHNIIARMDSDDISLPNRFERQIEIFKNDESLVLLGSNIREFSYDMEQELKQKKVPLSCSEIVKYSKSRNPFNHMSVIFKKNDIIEIGNYEDMPLFEDYYLWVRVLDSGKKGMNISDVLVNVRAGEEMIAKRSGYNYFKCEINFQRNLLKMNYISKSKFISNVILRGVPRLLPTKIVEMIYSLVLRKN